MIKFSFNWASLTAALLVGTFVSVGIAPRLLAETATPEPSLPYPNSVQPPTDSTLPQPQGEVAPGDRVPDAQEEMKRPNLDDITNYPDQVTTWVCNSNQAQTVVVEVKEISFWQNLTEETKNWQCSQNLPDIPGNKPTFSCEPTDTMGLLSVYWLKGKGGATQMQTWMQTLSNKYNLVCTNGSTNRYWE